jgi:hypothetical protein
MKPFKIIILVFFILSFTQVKSQTNILSIYPNPFTDTLNVQIYLAGNDTVTITVYSITGQTVATLAYDSIMAVGNHTIFYVAPSLANGVYFIMMKAGGQTTNKKIIKQSATNSIQIIAVNSNRVSIFPNPSNGNIFIQSSIELGLITIYNNIGQLVYQQSIKDKTTQVDLTQQSEGIYLIKVQNQYIKIIKE